MATEIERKFLVTDDSWRPLVTGRRHLTQGYLTRSNGPALVRVRIEDGKGAQLTVKSAGSGLVRGEFEYEIPTDDAVELMKLCGDHTLAKTRHLLPTGDLIWEIDVFEGRHTGLVVAEVELSSSDQRLPLPDWAGEEVTDDPNFSNEFLARPG